MWTFFTPLPSTAECYCVPLIIFWKSKFKYTVNVMQFKISNYSWHFIHHLKKTTKSIETIILFLSTAFLHFEYDYSRGSHFANYFRIIKSLQSICTTTSTVFIKKGVQKLAAFNASTSSSSGACPSVWAASDQQTNTEQSAKPPIKWHLLRQQFLRNLSRNHFNPYAHLTQILTIHSVQVF